MVSGDLNINKPSDDSAQEYGNHAPETDCYNTPEFESSMKKYQDRA